MNTLTAYKIQVSQAIGEVSCILNYPEKARQMIILAHGAGAGMRNPFMKKLSEELALQDICTLRYQFPYMEQGKKRPDKPEIAFQTIQAVHRDARQKYERLSIFLGGKSYGGRMSSQAVANKLIEEVNGIIFYGFPLHAPGKPSVDRGDHLFQVDVPMLFCQGSKDKLADIDLMKGLDEKLGGKAELYIVEEGDHSFHVPRSSNTSNEKVIHDLAKKTREWMVNLGVKNF
jgi:uncharacterized protein